MPRTLGARNVETLRREAAAAAEQRRKDMEAVERLMREGGPEGVFDGDAYEVMRWAYRNTALPLETRLDCAKHALRFEKPTLGSAVPGKRDPLEEMSEAELLALKSLVEVEIEKDLFTI